MEVPLDKPGSGNDSPRQKVLTKKRSRKHNESDSEAEEEKEPKRGKEVCNRGHGLSDMASS